MADKKITDLQLRSDVDDDVNFPIDDTIQTYRVTAPQVKAYVLDTDSVGSDQLAAEAITGRAAVTDSEIADLALIFDDSGSALKKISLPNFRKLVSIAKSSGFTLGEQEIYLCDATGGAFTATLPTASDFTGKVYTVRKVDSSVNKITFSGSIGGFVGTKLLLQDHCITFVSDGSAWHLLSENLPAIFATYVAAGGQSFSSSAGDKRIEYNTAILDPMSLVTTGSSWVFTSPRAGLYRVRAALSVAYASDKAMALYKNGSSFHIIGNTAAAEIKNEVHGNGEVSLALNDTISLYIGTAASAGFTEASVAVSHVGIELIK